MEASKIGGSEEDDEAEADAAQVEAEIEGDTGDASKARAVFERGYKTLKERGEKEDVSWLLEIDGRVNPDPMRYIRSEWFFWKPGNLSRKSKVRQRTCKRCKR